MSENPNSAVAAAVSAELAKHFDKVADVHKKVDDDLKVFKSIQDSTKVEIAKLNTDGAKLVADSLEQKRAQDARILDIEQKLAARTDAKGEAKAKSLGQQVIEFDDFKTFQSVAKDSSGRYKMATPFRTKTITSATGSAGPGAFPQYLPTVVVPNFQPLAVRDLLGVGQTDSNLIIWLQENVFTNNAGYQGSEGNLKPQSDISYTLKNIPVETIGHWFRASKQILSDMPQLMSLIDQRGTWGLKYAEEQELLYGSGASGHLHGLVPQAVPYNQPFVAGDSKIDTIRRAMLQVTLAFYPATGIVMSPSDWMDIQLTKDTQHRYIWANPLQSGPGMLWGLPVAEAFSMQRGDFIVGALKLAATIFDRQEASVLISTEDQDNVVRNLVTLLFEERLALAVSRPAAIVYGDFAAGSTGT